MFVIKIALLARDISRIYIPIHGTRKHIPAVTRMSSCRFNIAGTRPSGTSGLGYALAYSRDAWKKLGNIWYEYMRITAEYGNPPGELPMCYEYRDRIKVGHLASGSSIRRDNAVELYFHLLERHVRDGSASIDCR